MARRDVTWFILRARTGFAGKGKIRRDLVLDSSCHGRAGPGGVWQVKLRRGLFCGMAWIVMLRSGPASALQRMVWLDKVHAFVAVPGSSRPDEAMLDVVR